MISTAALKFALADFDVHVWWIDDSAASEGFEPDGQQGVRSRGEMARRRRAARRIGLRRVLAAYASVDPMALEIDRSCRYCGDPDHGRPRLLGDADLSFSTSSRPGHAVVAIARAAMSVGVDIESLIHFDAVTAVDIRRMSLTEGERTAVDSSDAAGIARLWCRKEAALKAMGLGIGGRDPASLDVRRDVVEGWHIADAPTLEPFVGALAARFRIGRILSTHEATGEPMSIAYPGDVRLGRGASSSR